MSSHVIDTSAWVEYLIGSRQGRAAREFIEGGGSATPSIVAAELAKWCLREIEDGRRTEHEMREHLAFVSSVTAIVPLDGRLAKKVGELDFLMKKRIRGWLLADSVVYATAKERQGKVVSGDPHFEGLPDVEYLK